MDMKRSLKVVIGFVLASALAGCQTTFYEAGTTPITLSPTVVAGFEKYKQTDYPLFFAVSTNGQGYGYYTCDSIYCDPDFSGQAISICERQSQSGGLDCKIFAFERSIVWKGSITYSPHIFRNRTFSAIRYNRSFRTNKTICSIAITPPHEPLGWNPQRAAWVEEAKSRNYTPEKCANLIAQSAVPESAAILCKMAITVADQPLGWDAGQALDIVWKAKLRGFTPEGCAKIIGR